jgi:hypothetical protein
VVRIPGSKAFDLAARLPRAGLGNLALQPFPIEEIATLGFDPEANLPEPACELGARAELFGRVRCVDGFSGGYAHGSFMLVPHRRCAGPIE